MTADELRKRCIEIIRAEAGRYVSSAELATLLDDDPIRISNLLYSSRPHDIKSRRGAGGGYLVEAKTVSPDPFHYLGKTRIAQIARFLHDNPGFHRAREIGLAIGASQETVQRIIRRYRHYLKPNFTIRASFRLGYILIHSPLISKKPRQPPSQHETKPMEMCDAETVSR